MHDEPESFANRDPVELPDLALTSPSIRVNLASVLRRQAKKSQFTDNGANIGWRTSETGPEYHIREKHCFGIS